MEWLRKVHVPDSMSAREYWTADADGPAR